MADLSEEPGRVVYVGPSLPARGLIRSTVYKRGVPESCAGEPKLAALFVPLSEFCAALAALKVEGSPLWCAYRDAAVAFSKRGA